MTVKYELPDLSYDYAALEPHISAQIMELHHSKHHQTYVNGVNTALEQQAEARDKGDFAAAAKASKDLSFNLGGLQMWDYAVHQPDGRGFAGSAGTTEQHELPGRDL